MKNIHEQGYLPELKCNSVQNLDHKEIHEIRFITLVFQLLNQFAYNERFIQNILEIFDFRKVFWLLVPCRTMI